MDTKRHIPKEEDDEDIIDEVVAAGTTNLYPDTQMDDGMLPRSKPESRAGLDCDGENGMGMKK